MQILSSKMVKKETPASGKLLLSLKVTGSPSEFTKRLNTQTFWHQSKGKLHDEVGAKPLPTAHCRSLWSITWCNSIPRSNSSRRTRSKEAADGCSAQKLLACFRYAQYDIKTHFSKQSRLIQVLTLRRWDVASLPTVSSYYVHIWLWYFTLYCILCLYIVYTAYHIMSYCIIYSLVKHFFQIWLQQLQQSNPQYHSSSSPKVEFRQLGISCIGSYWTWTVTPRHWIWCRSWGRRGAQGSQIWQGHNGMHWKIAVQCRILSLLMQSNPELYCSDYLIYCR